MDLIEGKKYTYQQIMGTKIYFLEKICFFLIHWSTLDFADPSLYKENHKLSKYAKEILFSTEILLHKSLPKQEKTQFRR